ncbi:putative type III secretion system-associated protein with FliK-like domain [Pseudomonas sp. StFLB209]|uniref:flagellar hook-length control protein FliK n=1 Tax=Pseudomonas sp. StFLB209 TaxID=1028989 RepID=UPI0004F91980|nr:flagellar hook-length control protein FliK [Pseudomonas sp. StFLB209]BAP44208.1 putative type III secretion system-associated protein with FliK-like domain [Pseudomonas sp. StFLB209]
MTGDIASVPPANPNLAQLRASITANQVLTLFNAAANLIPQGQTAEAEVVTLKQIDQQFQLLLRVMLGNGNQTSLQVTSNLPLTPGTQLLVAQASPNELTLSLQQINSALNNLKTELDTRQIPIGTLLQGKVLTSQVINSLTTAPSGPGQPAGPASGQGLTGQYRSIVLLLNTALAGTSLSIDSPEPLKLGSLLSARVLGSQALIFVPLPGGLDQLAVAQQLSTQQSRQGSLENLFNALQNLPRSQAPIAPALQARVDQLLADIPDIEQMASPRNVAQALNASGLFMESKLLAGQNLTQLPDMKANLMRLIAQILPPGVPANTAYSAAAASNTLVRVMPSAIRAALGTLGQLAPPVMPSSFPLPARDAGAGAEKDDLELLLKLAAAAVSRVQSHQLGALEQTRTQPDGTQLTTWQTEVPMRHAHEIVPLQVKVQREDSPERQEQQGREEESGAQQREQLWRIDLSFDLEPLGPLQVHAQLVRGTLSSQLWAQREDSAQLIERELGYLRERLVACGLAVGELACSHGSAPQGPRTHLEQRWIDENA